MSGRETVRGLTPATWGSVLRKGPRPPELMMSNDDDDEQTLPRTSWAWDEWLMPLSPQFLICKMGMPRAAPHRR